MVLKSITLQWLLMIRPLDPFRDSNLTQVFKEPYTGNRQTLQLIEKISMKNYFKNTKRRKNYRNYLIKEEKQLIQIYNQPYSIIEDDVNELNRVITSKSGQIKKLRFKLQQFKQHIIDEEDMSLQFQTHFYQKQHQN